MHYFSKFINSRRIYLAIWVIAIALLAAQKIIFSTPAPSSIDRIKLKGKILKSKDLSAIGFVGKYLLIGADEGNTIQVLKPNKKKTKYKVKRNIDLPIDKKYSSEIDIEGIAVSSNTVYVAGSHAANHKTKDKDKTELSNRQSVFSFQLNKDTGKLASTIQRASLQAILRQDKILSPFFNLHHDDNGVDIEGIAVKNNFLYFGFRSPVLQDDYVPVIRVKFTDLNREDRYELRHVNLGGNGIRDIVAVDEGFLILADGNIDDERDYRVYFWNGRDNLNDFNSSELELLSKIPTEKNTRAEGITILKETNSSYQVLVVYDGVAEGDPTIFEISK